MLKSQHEDTGKARPAPTEGKAGHGLQSFQLSQDILFANLYPLGPFYPVPVPVGLFENEGALTWHEYCEATR